MVEIQNKNRKILTIPKNPKTPQWYGQIRNITLIHLNYKSIEKSSKPTKAISEPYENAIKILAKNLWQRPELKTQLKP